MQKVLQRMKKAFKMTTKLHERRYKRHETLLETSVDKCLRQISKSGNHCFVKISHQN